jgi:hypothetical protein
MELKKDLDILKARLKGKQEVITNALNASERIKGEV